LKPAKMAMVLAAFLMVSIFGGISVAAAPQESGTSVRTSQVVDFHSDDPLPGPCSIPGGDPEHPCSIPGGDPEHPC
jgi:hypothetical protein